MSRTVRRLELVIRRLLPVVTRRIFRSSSGGPLEAASVRRILIIRQHNQLGDMLCVVPLLRALRASIPGAEIDLLASPVNADIMRHHCLLDDLLVYDKREYLGPLGIRIGRVRRLVKDLRARNYDLVAVPSTVSMSLTSDLLAAVTGAPMRFGPGSIDGVRNPGASFYSNAVDLDWRSSPTRHQTLRNADLLEGVVEPPEDLSHELTLTASEIEAAKDEVSRLRQGKAHLVAIHPGAGKPPNRWPARHFARLARQLASEMGAAVFATIGPMDQETQQALEDDLGKEIEYVVNKPIRTIASILSYVDLLVSNDTGIMHVGAAVGVPVISLFGPTEPRQWAPIGPRSRYIQGNPMSAITVEKVVSLATRMLSEVSTQQRGGGKGGRGLPREHKR